jgi:hypothetical protein
MDAAHRGLTALSEPGPEAVQAHGANEAENPASVHRAAAAGVSGAGSALPYFDRIKAAFGGAHDLSQVRAHVGGEAAAASEHMGAEAYATGDHVAFRDQPDLHTVAHEAAHVVQQRAGVQLTGGVGRPGDAYEQQADAVADAVTRGESAAALLGSSTGTPGHGDLSAGSPSTQALQMESAEDAETHVAGARGAGAAADASATERARIIHEAFHGSLFSEDEERALEQLRGQGVATIRRIRSAYQATYGRKLEDEFASYCDGTEAAEALALIWPAMPVIDRLVRNTGSLGDNEDGMMDVLRTATRSELAAAATDPRLEDLLDELSDGQQYEARRLIWPERKREHVLWRIERAHGTFNDDEDAVYTALLDLGPAERRALWDEREQHLSFLSESELALIRRMCVGENGAAATDAAALDVRMEIATEGLGTDDEAVSQVVGRVASLAEEETRLRATLDAGVTPEGEALSAEQRSVLEARLAEIGGVHETLLTSRRDGSGALAEDSFLGRLHDDVGTDEYGAFTGAMGGDGYERAKQQLLDAVGILNDDEDAIYRAFRDLRAPLELPPGRTTADYTPDELRQMQEQATDALRQRLRNDPDLAPVWSALNQDELAVLDVHAAGDTYRIAIHELEEAYHGFDTDEARIVRIVAGMSAVDRARMMEERPPIYTEMMAGLDTDEATLVTEVFRTGRVPTDQAIGVAMGGFGDGTDEQMLLDSLSTMPDEERRVYRLGYWLHKQGRTADDVEGAAQQQALQRFRDLHVRMEAELDDEELDPAMERLIGLPAPEDFLSPEGRRMAAEIMAHRHRERMAMSGGVTEAFTSTDETAEQSAMIYEAHLQQLLARGGEISLEDFSVLVGLDAQFGGRFDEYRATVEMVSNIAGTVAATVAAIVIVVLSKGTLAPAAAKLISSSGGAALWAAVAGAGARVATSEAFGGDFHQTMSTEGARDALVGAIEGAVAVASAALAARAIKFVGLSQRALSAELTRAALDSTEAGLALSGRGLARGSLEGAIDGFMSGAVGDLVMTATDADTWRRSVWNTLGSLGMSLLRGGFFGTSGGAVTGGALEGLGALRARGPRAALSENAGQLNEPPPLQRQLDQVTGVEKGPAYEQAQAQLREFYRQMELEAQQVTEVRGAKTDGPYWWNYGHDAQEFCHGLVNVRYRVFLDGQTNAIPPTDLERLQANVIRGIDQHYNFQHTIRGPSGQERRVHLEVEFVADPRDAHLMVTVHPGNGRAYLSDWFVDGHPTTHAHEVGHGAFGLGDEYVDPDVPSRATPTSPGVSNDQSLMGDYWVYAPDGTRAPAPGTRLHQRHLDEMSNSMGHRGASSPDAHAGSAAPSPRAQRQVELEIAQSSTIAERQQRLGMDPKRGYISHEGEVGAQIEKSYGYFMRDPSGAGEWISLSGPHEGKVFDLLGVPPGKAQYHSDAMERFLPSVRDHILKRIDFVVLDLRYMRPAQQATVKDYINNNFASEMGRLIILE